MHDLIVFGEDFGGLPSSTQHLVSRLAHDRKVLWINSIGLRQPSLTTADIKRAAYKLLGKSKADFQPMAGSNLNPNIKVITLKTIPAPKSAFACQIAKQMMLRQLRPILAKEKLSNPILWSSLPTAADLCGELNEAAVVYYCGDDFDSLAGVDHHAVHQHEKKLANKADLIFAASENIKAKFPAFKTQLLPHGVDVELFSTPAPRAHDLPKGTRPIAGFYGSLSDWLDYELITSLSATLSDWDFVFIGPNEKSKLALPQRENVFYLGARAHHLLPQYSQHWDISLLPFKPNPQIQACSPLKLMEYLAANSPIVASDFPALARYRSHVHVANSAEQMACAMRSIQAKNGTGQARETHSLVSQESWDNRSQFVHWMLELL